MGSRHQAAITEFSILASLDKKSLEFILKFSDLKIRMIQPGSESNGNTLIRKRIRTEEETNTTEKQGTSCLRQQTFSNTFHLQAFYTIKHMYQTNFQRQPSYLPQPQHQQRDLFKKARSLVSQSV